MAQRLTRIDAIRRDYVNEVVVLREQRIFPGVLLGLPADQGAQKTELRPNSYTEIWPKFDIFRVPMFEEQPGSYMTTIHIARGRLKSIPRAVR